MTKMMYEVVLHTRHDDGRSDDKVVAIRSDYYGAVGHIISAGGNAFGPLKAIKHNVWMTERLEVAAGKYEYYRIIERPINNAAEY